MRGTGDTKSGANFHTEKAAMKWKTLSEISVSKGRKKGAVHVLLHAVPLHGKPQMSRVKYGGPGGAMLSLWSGLEQ